MARVSRKGTVAGSSIPATASGALSETPERVYHTAAYVRLSVEDNRRDGNKDSIKMQQYMLEQYIAVQPDMRLEGIFCDNGETGTNFERSGFEAMMDDVRQRKIDCIIVKDLSRFGRNYVEAGYYLEKIFPYLGVRFVAVNDHYDTLKDTNGNELVLSLKNLVNDLYAKDISQKISSAIAVKQKNGEYIGSFAPYGYRKSPEDKHKLVIDEEVAPVIRDIFQWRAEGQGIAQVARRLNERNIPSPTMYKYMKGMLKKRPSNAGAIWQAQGVKALTRNPVYAGHMAQRKVRQSLSEGMPKMTMSDKEWIVVEHTHAPIVSQEIFDKVQEITQERHEKCCTLRGKYPSSENRFKGLLVCADCGTKMVRYKDVSHAGTIRYSFHCRVYAENLDGQGCTMKWVGEPELEEAVLQSLRVQIGFAADLKNALEKLQQQPEYLERSKVISNKISQVQQKIKRNSTIRSSLFESFSEKMLTEQEYQSMKMKYGREAEELRAELACLEREEEEYVHSLSPQNEWISALMHYQGEKVITQKMMTEFIRCIKVYGYNEVEIIWNFQDEFIRLEEAVNILPEAKGKKRIVANKILKESKIAKESKLFQEGKTVQEKKESQKISKPLKTIKPSKVTEPGKRKKADEAGKAEGGGI